jgi:adenine-specific DNA-methyltransferase
MEKRALHSPDLSARNIERIAELFPQVITESRDDTGKVVRAIDFDLLRQELSDHIVEGPQERYQLDWPGKRAAAFAANAPIAKTLRPMREESVDFDRTRNLFIEGDNLDALKLLQESYLGKVKLIYIDPPYNTGNDFIYEDAFAESSAEYLARSGQRSETGDRLVANTDANGRFHSDWLSMMYPRLKLARNLLRDDGLIFVSIDDHEAATLRSLLDEIFGPMCFLGTVTWLKKRKGSFLSKGMVSMHEYVHVYGRQPGVHLFGGRADESESQPLVKKTNNLGTLTFPGALVRTKLADGTYQGGTYGSGGSAVRLNETIVVRQGVIESSFSLTAPFIWSQPYLDAQIEGGARIVINTSTFQPRAFKAPDPGSHKGLGSVLDGVELSATNEDAFEYGARIFGTEDVLDYPKPVHLIRALIAAATEFDRDALVLDFFAGSGTTADAVIRQNAEDAGTRSFICVQLPETVDPNSPAGSLGFGTIADLARERIRRASSAVADSLNGVEVDGGFRSLRIDTTNMAETTGTVDAIDQGDLTGMIDSVKPNRTDEDLLFQVMLDWGLDLTEPIAVEEVAGTRILSVASDALVACFARNVTDAVVKQIAERHPLRAVFLDAGFASDAARINAEQIFRELSSETEVRTI